MKFYEVGDKHNPVIFLLPGFMKRWLEKKPADERLYYEKMLDMFGMNNTRMSFVERESIRNQLYSDLVTPI